MSAPRPEFVEKARAWLNRPTTTVRVGEPLTLIQIVSAESNPADISLASLIESLLAPVEAEAAVLRAAAEWRNGTAWAEGRTARSEREWQVVCDVTDALKAAVAALDAERAGEGA
jgi:hypothetical protein